MTKGTAVWPAKAVKGLSVLSLTPACLVDLIQTAVPVRLLSSGDLLLSVALQKCESELVGREFIVAAPYTWHDTKSCHTAHIFKRCI